MGTPGFHYYKRSLTTDLSLPFMSATTEEGKRGHGTAHKERALWMSRIRGRRAGKCEEENLGTCVQRVFRHPPNRGVPKGWISFWELPSPWKDTRRKSLIVWETAVLSVEVLPWYQAHLRTPESLWAPGGHVERLLGPLHKAQHSAGHLLLDGLSWGHFPICLPHSNMAFFQTSCSMSLPDGGDEREKPSMQHSVHLWRKDSGLADQFLS